MQNHMQIKPEEALNFESYCTKLATQQRSILKHILTLQTSEKIKEHYSMLKKKTTKIFGDYWALTVEETAILLGELLDNFSKKREINNPETISALLNILFEEIDIAEKNKKSLTLVKNLEK
jgi:hypothetical protein